MNARWIAVLCFCGLVAVATASARDKKRTLTGWVSDESCGAEHTKPGRADCVQKCWRGGASVGHPEWKPQRAVFVADKDRKIWIVENPDLVREFPAEHVTLTGRFDESKQTVRVERAAKIQEKNAGK